MAKLTTEVDPISGDEVAQIIRDTVNAPPHIIAKAKAIVGPSEKAQ
jgi:hypothetical protein